MYYPWHGQYNTYDGIVSVLRQLTIGTAMTIQYDDQAPDSVVFQGFQNGVVLVTGLNGFPGLARLNPRRINAISVP